MLLIEFDCLSIFCYNNKREICKIVKIRKIIEIIEIVNVLFCSLIDRLIFIIKIKVFRFNDCYQNENDSKYWKIAIDDIKKRYQWLFFFCSFRNSKFEKTKSKMIKQKRFVLKTNDLNKNEFFEFLRENLKLKKKFVCKL